MRFSRKSILARLLGDQRGQTLPFTAVILTSLMGLSGMAVDAGHGYYAYERLKVATNAATLAGAAAMPDTTTAQSNVNLYSSASSSDKNYLGSLMSNVVTTTTFSCASTVSSKLGVACETSGGGSGGYNAISVKQTATVKTWFGSLFGIPQFNIAATSMAAMAGGTNIPYNLAVLMDTTASMTDTSKEKGCTTSQKIACAVAGLQSMLQLMDPCAVGVTCSGSSSYVDDVSLYVFPAVANGNAKYDYTCPNSNPAIVPYTFPLVTASGTNENLLMPGSLGGYQVIDYSNDYKASDSASSLSLSSLLTKAVGYSGTGCKGLQAPGGEGTYYAQAIYQAQLDLAAQQAANPGSQNIMIIISDGDADAGNLLANNTSGADGNRLKSGSKDQITATSGQLNGTCTSTTSCTNSNATAVAYPSELGQCGQAVQAAQAATAAGTQVYTIAFDAVTSNGCATDQKYTATVGSTSTFSGTKFSGTTAAWPGNKSPCGALAAMASNTTMFYSDDTSGCTVLDNANSAYTSLATIFKAVVVGLTSPRLIPTGTT
jgi:Flp pilus assembly protein TadG